MSARIALPVLAALALSLPAAAQTTWFVDASALPPGNGTLGSPYTSVAYGLSQATTQNGDTLSVAPGTYVENVDFLGKAVTVEGQLPGVVIDGQWLAPCVSFTSGEGPTSVLRNVQLTRGGGAAVSGFTLSGGGGVLCVGSSPTLDGVLISGNGNSSTCVPHYGGGMFLLDSSPTLTDCSISGNFACEEAAGVIVYGASSPSFTDCSISFNVPSAFPGAPQGAGVSSYAVAPDIPTFDGCTFTGNQGGRGPALSGRAQAFDCLFQDNRGTVAGGAVFDVTLLSGCTLANNELFCDGSGANPEGAGAAEGSTLVDCVVIGNRGFNGGGVRNCTVTSSLIAGNEARYFNCAFGLALGGGAMDSVLVDCVLDGNTVEQGFGPPNDGVGGGMYGGTATGCLIVGNLADSGGAGSAVQLDRCTASGNSARAGIDGVVVGVVENSILWGNGSVEVSGAVAVSWSCVEGGFPGPGNIALDPEWWLATGDDWLLTPVSPCVDAGDPNAPTDPDGSRVDMGWRPLDAGYTGEPSSYCLETFSALGCQAQISWSGTPSLSGTDDFRVTASFVEAERVGLLVFARAPGAIVAPGGTLCLSAPFIRLPGQLSGGTPDSCTGTFDQPLTQLFFALQGMAAYDHGFAQYWYRSPGASGNAALSRALEFVVLP